jgi:hypothetical protein
MQGKFEAQVCGIHPSCMFSPRPRQFLPESSKQARGMTLRKFRYYS